MRKLTKDARTGRRIVAVAVFDVNSVRKVSIMDITNTITKCGMDCRDDNWQPSHIDNPECLKEK